jgi:hypothetical protein
MSPAALDRYELSRLVQRDCVEAWLNWRSASEGGPCNRNKSLASDRARVQRKELGEVMR